MNIFKLTSFAAALFLATFNPVSAQWQTPQHSVPIGQGAAVTGFGSATPGTAGLPFVSNGASADPSFQPVGNSGLAAAAALSVKCNPTGSLAAVQDCTGAQVASIGLNFVNTFIVPHQVAQADCGGMVQMGTGSTGQIAVTLTAPSSIVGVCTVRVFNGDLYSAGVSTGKILTGFPAGVFPTLFPGQSIDIHVSAGAWVVDRNAGRWSQFGPQIYAAKSTGAPSDTANDCLSLTHPCLTITQTMTILYGHVDNMNAAPNVLLNLGDSFAECVVVQGQLTGTNVGFIKGNGGNVNWSTSGPGCGATPAAINIGDNAEWEVQNITFFLNQANSFGIFVHQPGVVDVLSGVHFTGTASGTTAISSDHGGFINVQSASTMNITGTVTSFLGLGSGTQSLLGIQIAFIGTVAMTDFITIGGAGTQVTVSSFSFTGTAPSGLVRDNCTGPSEIALSGQTLPGTAGTPAHGCQVF